MDKKDILKIGQETLQIEIDSLILVKSKLSNSFIDAVEAIYNCTGRVVVVGIGKSGQIAKKIAATLASTGTPSFFLHPAEGMHGDLGMIVKGDIVIMLSNSGETEEIKSLLPTIKRFDVTLISIVGNINSTLAKFSDIVIDATVEKEACSLNLAPTSSTTVALALGDAIAVALVEKRGFKAEDFLKFHPSGSLGKKLLIKVLDIMRTGDDLPIVNYNSSVDAGVNMINEKGFGCTAVLNKDSKLIGIITDGDIRRAAGSNILNTAKSVEDIMTVSPKVISSTELVATAIMLMEKHKITTLFVVDDDNHLVGLIHFQDILVQGII